MKKKRGFTVVEMLVTVAILAVLIVMALQMGRSAVQKATLTAAINEFIADFNYARQLASRENRYVAFVFNDTGTAYTIRVLRRVSLNPTLETSYVDHKTHSPLGGEPCLKDTTDFAVNSMGVIRQYPVDPNANPITVTMDFYKAQEGAEWETSYDPSLVDYQKTITIFPTGGIKIEDSK
ncbi:MAG: prepilin-type N-terminal cleavage/methylation domain-containing protein [Candidatus Aminicenantes bacterium]|nr:MAG: prepilin-type N-terminal cleavage/methylation domain-containing protein [Candidatus Aminicenantes bacterium]